MKTSCIDLIPKKNFVSFLYNIIKFDYSNKN